MSVTENRRCAPVAEAEPIGRGPVEPDGELAEAEERGLARYSLFERILHWVVAITFVALLLSGCGYNTIQVQDEATKSAWSERAFCTQITSSNRRSWQFPGVSRSWASDGRDFPDRIRRQP